ncbi:efflux RND transporter periplasmic adaptor subunit [Planctomicrobium piriforme]|uniref:RND family efflux transporter, MFP subunit n=1 Tax=Planctomicrobium piriforme TaxID=1576369 RepID=A0A1I3B063_9PLAN|nr:efflux RND transporter periplasmic adaptor subunit [Planctomicrobium piriforme]SFH55705.1 RND family efflux transporter, MFP subunit [Planctomicrobium piriforme]
MKISPVTTLILILVYFSLPGCQSHQEKVKQVVAIHPQSKDVTISQAFHAQIQAERHIPIRAPIKGVLKSVAVQKGQAVNAGEMLFEIEPVLDPAKSIANSVPVNAPFAGVIGRLETQPGSPVRPQDILTTLTDSSVMRVYFNVPEAHYLESMASLKPKDENLKIGLQLADGTTFDQPGTLEAIAGVFNPETGSIAFRADFPNPEGQLHHGQTGDVLLYQTLHDAIVIPEQAAFELRGKRYVYVVDASHMVQYREVVVQNEVDDFLVVESGVGVDDTVILTEAGNLRAGEKVEWVIQSQDSLSSKLK